MYGYGYYGYGMDPTVLLLVIGMILSLAASAKLKSTFAVYKKVRNHSGITGAEAAQRILRAAGITDVQVVPIRGSLTDHYDPRTKTVSLSEDIYGRNSLAAVGVAANALVMLPFYSNFMPMETILAAGAAINPAVGSVWTFAFFCVGPFNLVKGIVVSVVTSLVYKRVSVLIHSVGNHQKAVKNSKRVDA